MGLLSSLLGPRWSRERREAARLGITVAEVTRDVPFFSPDGAKVIYHPYRCVRYSLPRRERKGRPWALLQRTKALGATLPNDYLLSKSGMLPAALEEQLRKVAQDYPQGLFEFEATASDVAVYWSEWGGVDKVRALHAHLERLASY